MNEVDLFEILITLTRGKFIVYWFLGFAWTLWSCNPTRYLTKNQALVTKVKILGMSGELNEKALTFLKQKPNRRLLLALYNTFNTSHGHYKDSTKIKKGIGEEPVIYDTSLTIQSNTQLKGFLKDQGYFDATVTYDVRFNKNKKRAYITYTAYPKLPYYISSFTDSIQDTALRKIYQEFLPGSLIKPGKIYTTDDLESEQARINDIYRENGYYKFSKQYVRFIVFDTLKTHQVHLELIVENPDSDRHRKYYMDSVLLTVHADHDQGNAVVNQDTLDLKNDRFFFDPYNKFRPKIVRNTLYFKKGEIFRNSDQQITYRRLAQLGVFRQIRIDYKELEKDSLLLLNANIDVTQSKKLSISISGEGTLNQDFYGINTNFIYSDHNFLKGAELFEYKIGGTLNNNFPAHTDIYNRKEFTTQASLQFPLLLLPFYHPVMGKHGDLPHTKILAGYSYITQPLFNRREYLTSLTYQFQDTRAKIHTITPIELSLLNAYLDPGIIARFDSTGNKSRLQSFTSSIISGSAYNYEQNGYLLRTHQDFLYFNGHLELVGNTLSLVDRYLSAKPNRANGKLFGLPYYQFVKPEIDFRWYKTVGLNGTLVFRIAPGIAYSYGKSDSLKSVPFDRQFYVGGPNSIRAWPSRQLGPGSYLRPIPAAANHIQDSLAGIASELRALDQTGEVKLEGNVEYRFLITSNFFGRKLSGASFLDFGNIWLSRQDTSRPGANFNFHNFGKQIAIGTGIGIRYDLSFFIFRFDVGLKLYDPIFSNTDGWVIKYYGSEAFRNQYYSQFGGIDSKTQAPVPNVSTYRWVTYNFGIGFPF
jgi:outer membrane translocation and assembly module TamA